MKECSGMKIIYIMGKSSSGKDTIYNVLNKKLDVSTYVMYTTRPIRDGEVDGVTYNFISQDEMQDYIDGNKGDGVIEYRTYKTVYGPWTYATIGDGQFDVKKDMLMLGTLESYEKVKGYFANRQNVELMPIYVEVPDNIRLKRAIEREEKEINPKYVELCRRFIVDSKDFLEENLQKVGIGKRFQNLDLNKCVNEIICYIERENKRFSEKERD